MNDNLKDILTILAAVAILAVVAIALAQGAGI